MWTADGETLVTMEGLDVRYIEASTGKVLGVITAGNPPLAPSTKPMFTLPP